MMATRNPAQARYRKRMALTMTLYVVTLFAGDYLIDHAGVTGPLAWLLALLPGLAVVGFFLSIFMLIREEEDEFLRMLIVRQMLFATGIALSSATVWGFFEQYDLVSHIEAYWWAILWFFGLGLGGLFNRITMGSWGECW